MVESTGSLRDARKAMLLLAVHNFFLENPMLSAIEQEDLAQLEPGFPRGFVEAVLESLIDDECVKEVRVTRAGYGTAGYALTRGGLRLAEELHSTPTPVAPTESDAFVPASDRVVRLDDNAPEVKSAIETLEHLESALVSGSNELPLTADERRVVASEARSILDRMRSGWIRIGEVQRAVTKGSPLVWLADKVGGTAVGALVLGAITALGVLAKALLG